MNKKVETMIGCVVHDATSPLEIRITMEGVTAAQCGNENSCVIAQAVLAKFPDVARSVFVGHYYTKVVFDGYVLRFKNPAALTRGLKAFDATKGPDGKGRWDVVPIGVYTLLPPAPSERLGRKRTKSKKPSKERVPAPVAVYVKPRSVTRCPVVKSNRQAKQANQVKGAAA